MSGIYIPGMEMPKGCAFCKISRRNSKKMICPFIWKCEWDIHDPMSADHRLDDCPLIPVPDHGLLLKVLKTERECVSRDCDRNCGKCDLSLERDEIVGVYDALIAMLDPADKEGEG